MSAAVTSSCKRTPAPHPDSRARLSTKTTTANVVPLRPLQAAQPQIQLELPDTPPTSLVIPRGITAKAPLVVILGGPSATLQARCTTWAAALPSVHFVLCQAVRSVDRSSREPTSRADEKPVLDVTGEAARALKTAFRAVKRRFGAYVDGETVSLVGVDDGASLVPALMRQSPTFFPRLALIEQGFDAWSAVDSARLSEVHRAKVLLVCSSESCSTSATRVAVTLKSSGTAVELLGGSANPPGADSKTDGAIERPKSDFDPRRVREALAQLLRKEEPATK